jgi:hypothetical protein
MPRGIYVGNKGKKMSEESKKRISANSAKFWMGKSLPMETRRKISLANKGKRMGEKIWNWRGGVTEQQLRARKMRKLISALRKIILKNTPKKIQSFNKNSSYGKRYPKGATEKKRFTNMRYKMRKRNALGSHTFIEWMLLKNKYKNMCLCCKRFEPEIKLSEDHIVPISIGGTDYISNIQPLCVSCNTRKHTKTISYLPTRNDSSFIALPN